MEEQKNPIPEEEIPPVRIEDQSPGSLWQQTKESWYDKLPVTLKQMDIIVGICWGLIGLTAIAITLETLDIWHLFG